MKNVFEYQSNGYTSRGVTEDEHESAIEVEDMGQNYYYYDEN
jgi:hypothetical protein